MTTATVSSPRDPRTSAFQPPTSTRPIAAKMITAASVALGSRDNGAVRNSSTSATVTAWARPTTWVRPPTRTFTALRDPLDPTGNDWDRPAIRLSPARPIISWSASTGRSPGRARLRAVRIASENATRAMPTAEGASIATSPSDTAGHSNEGSPAGMSPTSVTPCEPRSAQADTAIEAIVTRSRMGNRGHQRPPISRAVRQANAIATVGRSTSPRTLLANDWYS